MQTRLTLRPKREQTQPHTARSYDLNEFDDKYYKDLIIEYLKLCKKAKKERYSGVVMG